MNFYDRMAEQEIVFVNDIQHSFQKLAQTWGFNAEKLARWMFCDVLFLLYANALADEHNCNIKYDNLKIYEVDDYTGKRTQNKKAKLTTYIECETRYKKLFNNNTTFIESKTGQWLRVKLRRRTISNIKGSSVIFSLYILNKLYSQYPSKEIEIKNSLDKRFNIQEPLHSLQWILRSVVGKEDAHFCLITYTGDFWSEFYNEDTGKKFNDDEYILLITQIHVLLTDLFCQYAGITIRNTLITDFKPVIVNELQFDIQEPVPYKKATELIYKRLCTMDKNSDLDVTKKDYEETLKKHIQFYEGILSLYDKHIESISSKDLNISDIEAAIYKKVDRERMRDRDKRKRRELLNILKSLRPEALNVNSLREALSSTIGSAYFISPKDTKELLRALRKSILKIGNIAQNSLWSCAEAFNQAYCICNGLSLFGSSEAYHTHDILGNVAILLNSYITTENDEHLSVFDVIIDNLAAAYKIKIRDCIMNDDSSTYGFIHSHLCVIIAIMHFAIRHMNSTQLNYKGWLGLIDLIFYECNSLYDTMEQFFEYNKDKRVKELRKYIIKNDLVAESKQYFREICQDCFDNNE